jgi:transketolase
VVLDGEVGNSTYAEIFQQAFPERFFEMYVAEQNMVGAALGLARRGRIPFVSTFAAFFTRAFDQIRMSRYSDANITFCGSHAGVAIGEDGASQMGLEDIAMFTLIDSVVNTPPTPSRPKLVGSGPAPGSSHRTTRRRRRSSTTVASLPHRQVQGAGRARRTR